MELLVVVAIFVVMTGLLLVNFRRSRQRDALRLSTLRFTAAVQQMRTHALAGSNLRSQAEGYGVHLNASRLDQYILFADRTRCTGSGQSRVCAANGRYDPAGNPREDLDAGTVTLPQEVRLGSWAPAGTTLDMLFTLPRGTAVLTPNAAEAVIPFVHRATQELQVVRVNPVSGRVSVDPVQQGSP